MRRGLAREPQNLIDLRNAADRSAQLAVLRRIKNDLTGHQTRKAEYIRYGIITLLDGLIVDSTRGARLEVRRVPELVCDLSAYILCLLAHGRSR